MSREHWRNFWVYWFPFPVLYHKILVKLGSILGPEESGIIFWHFFWLYVLVFQWLSLHNISLEWSDQYMREFQSCSNRPRLLRPNEDCETIKTDPLCNTGCRQLEINMHLLSLSLWAHQPKQVEASSVYKEHLRAIRQSPCPHAKTCRCVHSQTLEGNPKILSHYWGRKTSLEFRIPLT